MLNPYFFESDLAWHAEKVRMDYATAQRPVSVQHIRAAVGHSLIRIGTSIQGKALETCEGYTATSLPLVNAGR